MLSETKTCETGVIYKKQKRKLGGDNSEESGPRRKSKRQKLSEDIPDTNNVKVKENNTEIDQQCQPGNLKLFYKKVKWRKFLSLKPVFCNLVIY